MNYAQVFMCDIANGPGCRTSLFVSGCTHHCKDCFNEMAWDFQYGKEFTQHVQDVLIEESRPAYIRGFTFLGGEPMEIDFHRFSAKEGKSTDISWSAFFDQYILNMLSKFFAVLEIPGHFIKTVFAMMGTA